MARKKTIFMCRECGYETRKWMGRCPGCQAWNSVVEELVPDQSLESAFRPAGAGEIKRLGDIDSLKEERLCTGINELDRVLGGGAVPGSAVLVGGDPGIGKSTLLLQAALGLAGQGYSVVYVAGEESLQQIKMRSERIGQAQVPLLVLSETDYNRIADRLLDVLPQVVIVDSIQTVMKSELGSVPGSVVQVREVTASLVQLAKSGSITFFIVGHVTKEGNLAGPRLLEHMVDSVLYLEGERYHSFRILRGIKNRFGSTNDTGIFTMDGRGLIEVHNPSALFLEQRPRDAAGSVVVPTMEGSRPLMVEIQGLVTPSCFGGNPRRNSTGLDFNRVALLVAVLEKRAGFQLQSCDVFINVVGGVKIMEPAADLGVAMALASSSRDRPVPYRTMVVGEVGLTGEVRPVGRLEERLREGVKMGFNRCLVPRGNLAGGFTYETIRKDLDLAEVSTLAQALDFIE